METVDFLIPTVSVLKRTRLVFMQTVPVLPMLMLRFHPGARTRDRGLHTSAFARHLGLALGTALLSRLIFGGSVTLDLAADRKVARRIAHCCRLVAHSRKEVAFRLEYQITSRARARVSAASSPRGYGVHRRNGIFACGTAYP